MTGAVESSGTSYAYAYDLVGNRTQVKVNGTVTESRDYNAADQVVGWTYDAAGNLLSDGTLTTTYDALNRALTATGSGQSRSYAYNGDGVLVSQSANGATTRFTQDLASPLSQILQTQGNSTTNYLYGHERLANVSGGTRTWYGTDALGSVRETRSDNGALLDTFIYDPWGTPQGGVTPDAFGFTGEWHDSVTGLINLRARWYQPRAGRFVSRDPFEGFAKLPYSLHPYQYGFSNPVRYTDPSGQCVLGLPCPFDDAWDETRDGLDDAWDKTRDGLDDAWDETRDGLDDAWDEFSDAFRCSTEPPGPQMPPLPTPPPAPNYSYTVNPHAYGRPNHAADEAEVHEKVRQVVEWWYDPSSPQRKGNALFAGLAGSTSGPVAIILYNASRNVINDLFYEPTLIDGRALVNRRGYTQLVASSPIP